MKNLILAKDNQGFFVKAIYANETREMKERVSVLHAYKIIERLKLNNSDAIIYVSEEHGREYWDEMKRNGVLNLDSLSFETYSYIGQFAQ